jgi:glutamine synthetase
MGMTATFLPKPFMGINGNGMHTNISLSKNNKNLFFDKRGKSNLSNLGWEMIKKILGSAADICLVLNSSVNSYRRLDPNFEAPNEIKVSEVDRAAMIRIPLFNERSARFEVRGVAPDANPYLVLYALTKTGLEGPLFKEAEGRRSRVRYLPGDIQTAMIKYRRSNYTTQLFGDDLKARFIELKQQAADRSPVKLGTKVKNGEVIYHHEVYNQILWNDF